VIFAVAEELLPPS